MKKGILAVVLIAVVAGIGLAVLRYQAARKKEKTPKPKPVEQVRKPVGAPLNETEKQLAVALDNKKPVEDRGAALDKLGRNLTKEQQTSVRRLINTRGEDAVIRNEAFNVLARQHEPLSGLVLDLANAWNDDTEEELWRDFALQHMVPAYELGTAKEKKIAVDTLVDAASDPVSKSAGTALLSLKRLGKRNPEIAKKAEELAKKELARDEINPERYGAALDVAVKNKDTSVLPKARTVARDEKAPVPVRMSSIAAIGALGTEKDVALLEGLLKHKESRIRRAAKYQLDKLKNRIAGK